MQGKTFSQSPFITSILAPQLDRKGLSLHTCKTLQEFSECTAQYALLDGADVLGKGQSFCEELRSALGAQRVNIALTIRRDFQSKLELLDLGFSYCLDLPVATQVVIRSIENSVTQNEPLVSDSKILYGIQHDLFHYFTNTDGALFLSHGSRSVYLAKREKELLDYLYRRREFASRGELAYAGWKSFAVKHNTVIVTIKNLRRKLHYLKLPYSIRNLYGFGYKLEKL